MEQQRQRGHSRASQTKGRAQWSSTGQGGSSAACIQPRHESHSGPEEFSVTFSGFRPPEKIPEQEPNICAA
eukprot:1158096-Pelagomonas_calceolata.AAC.4